ncbi:MAG: aminopeptidase N [Campylobacterota bacterium]|nr:aminopeptidase N [Campylobacterota bacterium]
MSQPKINYLSDYKPSAFAIIKCDLIFDIFDTHTLVTNTMQMQCEFDNKTLILNGEHLKLESLTCNAKRLEDYELSDTYLSINNLPKIFTLEIVTRIYPHNNTELEGLYHSADMFCTQNEPEGFRRITYFLDRPDVMSVFTTKVIADKNIAPILLSNGNFLESGDLENGRHFVTWHDPFMKPTYLFALVAGDLGFINDSFKTMSGREIELNIYCDHGNENRCYHAMSSLKKAMKWDEEVYGREYDLDIYNIVAVDSFNMGAMENKGLNIFNSAYVLADEERATDQNFLGIESVIAHEYFHNWTGNRITCRDWFQLTLKEGLTVFRDQNFSADMNEAVTQRISDVKSLRERQFLEDASPTSHPIKPKKYMEINNFYTATIYEKGAEVIRMIYTILGKERFKEAMDLYFKTFDAQAVRTEDFLWAMSEGGHIDLTQFERWYHQERTPLLHVKESYDEIGQVYTLELTQEIPKSVTNAVQLPYHYPLEIALFDAKGNAFNLSLKEKTQQPDIDRGLLHVREESECFRFKAVTAKPILSINRNFTAPIKVIYDNNNHSFLMRYDSDGFNRYEASQGFAMEVLFDFMAQKQGECEAYLDAFGAVLHDDKIDMMLKSQILELPSTTLIMQAQDIIDVDAIYEAKKNLKAMIYERFYDAMSTLYRTLHDPANRDINNFNMGKRALKNLLLNYLISSQKSDDIAYALLQYRQSATMTDRIIALDLLENYAPLQAESCLNEFYKKYKNDTLVMNKYFSILAAADRGDVLDRVHALQNDPVYDIKVPNLVRSLIGVFARNARHFHAKSGYGYSFIADKIIELDKINPMIASGLSGAFKSYSKLDKLHKALMKGQLERILSEKTISKNVYEIVQKILKG